MTKLKYIILSALLGSDGFNATKKISEHIVGQNRNNFILNVYHVLWKNLAFIVPTIIL